jgi:uridine phosphorylase
MAFFVPTACLFLGWDSGHNQPMSLHIGAQKGEISEKILLPGDHLRAKWVAVNCLDGAKQYN